MIVIDISDEYRHRVDNRMVEKAALATLRHESAYEDSELTIVVTSDDQLQALNSQFREIDAPTDVLSFPASFIDPETESSYLGDVIISYPRAMDQAALRGHPVMAEIQLLVVHGVLHLLEYDHGDPSEKAKMWTAQKEILHQLGLEKLKIPDSD